MPKKFEKELAAWENCLDSVLTGEERGFMEKTGKPISVYFLSGYRAGEKSAQEKIADLEAQNKSLLEQLNALIDVTMDDEAPGAGFPGPQTQNEGWGGGEMKRCVNKKCRKIIWPWSDYGELKVGYKDGSEKTVIFCMACATEAAISMMEAKKNDQE